MCNFVNEISIVAFRRLMNRCQMVKTVSGIMQLEEINTLQEVTVSGTVTAILGMLIECAGIERLLSVGARCRVVGQKGLQGNSRRKYWRKWSDFVKIRRY